MGNADSVPGPPMQMAQHRVQLAATPISPFIPKAPRAYHTSVIVDAVEYFFCRRGVVSARNFQSHQHLPNGPDNILDIGYSNISGPEMVKVMRPYFREGTYDLLRKNCNSFSDCALFYLCGKRADSKYSELEQIGSSADQSMGLVRMLSLGEYGPNPRALTFNIDNVLDELGRGMQENKENVVQDFNAAQRAKEKNIGLVQDMGEYVCSPKAHNFKLDNIVDAQGHAQGRRPTLLGAETAHGPPPISHRGPANHAFSMGQRVKVFSYMHKGWVGATVKYVQPDGTITVLYDSGEHQKDVPGKEIANVVRRHEG